MGCWVRNWESQGEIRCQRLQGWRFRGNGGHFGVERRISESQPTGVSALARDQKLHTIPIASPNSTRFIFILFKQWSVESTSSLSIEHHLKYPIQHGVKRVRQSREALEARKLREQSKIKDYLALTQDILSRVCGSRNLRSPTFLTVLLLFRRGVGTGRKTHWILRRDFYTLIRSFTQYGIIGGTSYCMEYFQIGATPISSLFLACKST